MNQRIQLSIIVGIFVAALSLEALALTHDIRLFRVQDIHKQGISATVREKESGVLECQLVLDQKRTGSPVTSIELSSSTQGSAIDFDLHAQKRGHDLVCRFSLSRDLLMHANLIVGVGDGIPGGTCYHVAFVDFVDFGKGLSPVLKKRQERLEEMGLLDRHNLRKLEDRLERYSDTTPMRGEGIDAKELVSKVQIVLFSKPTKKPLTTQSGRRGVLTPAPHTTGLTGP